MSVKSELILVDGFPKIATHDAPRSIEGWNVRTTYSGKLGLPGQGGEGPLMRSIAVQLYGQEYAYAKHIAVDPLDLRRDSFVQSFARMKRLEKLKR